MGVIAWKKCDDQELVFITLLEPPQCEAGVCLLTSPEVQSCFVFIFPPFAIPAGVIIRFMYYSLFHARVSIHLLNTHQSKAKMPYVSVVN